MGSLEASEIEKVAFRKLDRKAILARSGLEDALVGAALDLDKFKGRSKGVEDEVEATGLKPLSWDTIAFRASRALGLTMRGLLDKLDEDLILGPKGSSRTLGAGWDEVEGTGSVLAGARGSGIEGRWTGGQEVGASKTAVGWSPLKPSTMI
jgi:hypothetical protein